MHEWNSVGRPDGLKFNILIDAVVTIFNYKKSTIYHAIYIKVLYNGTVSCFTVSADDFLNTTNNETESTELKIVF